MLQDFRFKKEQKSSTFQIEPRSIWDSDAAWSSPHNNGYYEDTRNSKILCD